MKNTKTRIGFDIDGVRYTLEYTADSLKQMERNGVNFSKLEERVLTATEELFCGAFIANHRYVPMKKRQEIYKMLCESSSDGKEALSDVIGNMLTEALDELTNRGGNVAWEVLN